MFRKYLPPLISVILVLTALTTVWGDENMRYVRMETDKGIIYIELYMDSTPITAGNIIKLVNEGFYNGIIFHRVEPGFVVQGGDPLGTGMGGPGYTIQDEDSGKLHKYGSLGMAKTSEPNSAGSQFYFCLDDLPQLDGGYTVFGRVLEGMNVVEKIEVGDKMLEVMEVYYDSENKVFSEK